MRCIVAMGLVLCLLSSVVSAGDITGYEAIADWSTLPTAKTGVTSHLASSYDRTGANEDWNWYEGYDRQLNTLADNNLPVTLLDVQGSGVLTRYWMPHATANDTRTLTITVDAGLPSEAVITTTTNPLFYGSDATPYTDLFEGSTVATVAGGQTLYEPIAFTTSLKVESINRTHLTSTQPDGPINGYSDRHYYQLNYTLYDGATRVEPFSPTLSPGDVRSNLRQQALSILDNVGENPAGLSTQATVHSTGGQSIAAGQGVSLVDLGAGSEGTIRRLNVKMDTPTKAGLENLRVRVRYDGEAAHAVDVPVGAFFGAASVDAPAYKSLPMGTDSADGFYCYLPMPYRDGVVVELYNAGTEAVSIDGGVVEYESGPVEATAGYLHAAFAESSPGSGKHEILNVTDEGHYVGNILTLKAPDRNGIHRRILEGDETLTVDGTNVLQGTGLEDAYSGGFYYNHVLDQNNDGDPVNPIADGGAFSGLLLMDTVDDLANGQPDIASGILQVSQYRWQIQDLVAFEESLNIEIENFGDQDAMFQSTAFYYAVPEPASVGFLMLGGLGLLRRRKLKPTA